MKRGFSLVELSIVLVILGLLTGGILAGQNLIRAAELRSVSTQFQSYVTATQTFRDKYFAIPGDMRNATDFWGTTTCPGTAGTGTQTCNGDGDGQVEASGATSQYTEHFTFWQHLSNAGLIEGNYTGIAGSASSVHAVGNENSPTARLANGLWFSGTTPAFAGTTSVFAGDYGNYLFIGRATATLHGRDPILTPEEAWNIDTKMDDGKPGTGSVWTYWWDTCTDAASNGGTTPAHRDSAEYLLQTTSAECALYFRNAF